MEHAEELERYLEGEMKEQEGKAFEALVAKDAALAERLRLHRLLEGALGNQEEIAVEDKLRHIMESTPAGQVTDSEAPVKRPMWGYFSAAAAGVLLLVAVKFIFFNGPMPLQKLYAMHYAAYDGSGEVRSGNEVPKGMLDAAFEPYNQGEFGQAAQAFQAILDSFPENARAHFYLGNCQLEEGQFAAARPHFEAVIAEGKNLYLDQAHWYLGLACLQEQDLVCAKMELSPLAEKPGAYREGASLILEELE